MKKGMPSWSVFPAWWQVVNWWALWPDASVIVNASVTVDQPVVEHLVPLSSRRTHDRGFDKFYMHEQEEFQQAANAHRARNDFRILTQRAKALLWKCWCEQMTDQQKQKYIELLGDRRSIKCLLAEEELCRTPAKKKSQYCRSS